MPHHFIMPSAALYQSQCQMLEIMLLLYTEIILYLKLNVFIYDVKKFKLINGLLETHIIKTSL